MIKYLLINKRQSFITMLNLSIFFLTNIIIIECSRSITRQQEKIQQEISVQQAYHLIRENKNNENFIIIDVRTPREFSSGHVKNALNLNISSDNFKAKLEKLDKNKTYLFYCRIGVRSRRALYMAKEMGFNRIYNMLGGMLDWKKVNHPTE